MHYNCRYCKDTRMITLFTSSKPCTECKTKTLEDNPNIIPINPEHQYFLCYDELSNIYDIYDNCCLKPLISRNNLDVLIATKKTLSNPQQFDTIKDQLWLGHYYGTDIWTNHNIVIYKNNYGEDRYCLSDFIADQLLYTARMRLNEIINSQGE